MPIKKALRPVTLVVTAATMLVAAGSASATVATTPPSVAPLAEDKCVHGEMSQALEIFGDYNTYTMAPGGLFDSADGWQLTTGARIVSTTQPDGTTAGVLELAGGSQATSPVMCITQHYPMARIWSRQVSGKETISFNVQYLDKQTGLWTSPQDNGDFAGAYYWDQGFDWTSYTDWAKAWADYANSPYGQWLKYSGFVTGVKAGWRLSPELAVAPNPEDPGWQQVRFTFYGNGSSKNKSQIDAFWVDPRGSR